MNASFIRLCVVALLAGVCPSSVASLAHRFVAEGLEAEARMDPAAALESFRKAVVADPDNAFIEQKIAQQLSDAAFLETDPGKRLRLAAEALTHAERATELDPSSAVARLSLAVLYGKLAVEGDVGTKIEYARRIRSHAEQAVQLDPDYAWGWHVLGRWHVELSQLGMAKRALVSLFFGGLPEASLEEGTMLLEKAVGLEGDAIPHRVELGFAYQRAGRIEDARACWEAALRLPSIRIYDDTAKQRASSALGEMQDPVDDSRRLSD